MKAALLGLVLVLLALACGARDKTWELRYQKKNEIGDRWSEIREWRREMELPLDPRPEDLNQVRPKPIAQIRGVCPTQQIAEGCADVCTLAGHICDNAESICNLADELGKGDSWAQEKCASAKASCRDAKQRCCAKCREASQKAAW